MFVSPTFYRRLQGPPFVSAVTPMSNLQRAYRDFGRKLRRMPMDAPAPGREDGTAAEIKRYYARIEWDKLRQEIFMRVAPDLNNVIYEQLPRTIRDKVIIDSITDAFQLYPRVEITYFPDPANREVKSTEATHLEPTEFEGMHIYCKLPDVFVARLCVLIP